MTNSTQARIARLSPAARIRHYESMERFYLAGNNTQAAARMRNAAHFTALNESTRKATTTRGAAR